MDSTNEGYKNKYEIIKRIGRGQYTEVYQAKNKTTKELNAIKIIKLDDIKEQIERENLPENIDNKLKEYIEGIKNEILNMQICSENNENSVKFYESFISKNEFVIVLELCDESLTKYLIRKKECFNIKEISEILSQLNKTFKIMQEKKIVHRDLKPDNILIKFENKKIIVKLCDYGISKIGNFTRLNTHTGTTYYMAPEIMELTEENNYNYKCDLWSLGIIIYELCFKEKPYKGITEHAILKEIKIFGKDRLKSTGDKILDDLIRRLLEKNPINRLTWEEYFNHPFFSQITMIYKRKFKEENEIKIFGHDFVNKNFNECKIEYKGKNYPLEEYFQINKDEDFYQITLNGVLDSTFSMFYLCESLEAITDISKWNTNNITDMSYMFYGCNSLISLPDISKWNTNKVTNLSYMFYGCKSLISLPDISKWNTKNVVDMSGIFYYCSSLNSLPDISKWDTINVNKMTGMFYYCESLISLPDISIWNLKNVTNISYMFRQCRSLKYLPDISKWNTNNISNMSELFYHCDSLISLPDISKWDTNNVEDMNNMFSYCNSLKSMPEISKWDINNVINKSNMFYGCNNFFKYKFKIFK